MNWSGFIGDQRGAVAVVGAFSGLLLILSAGAATDFARGVNTRSNYQQILDSAVLAAGSVALTEPAGTTPDLARMTDAADSVFNLNISAEPGPISVTRREVNYDAASDSVVGRLDLSMQTSFLGLIGVSSFSMSLKSTANRPRPSPLQVVMALDATSSMGQTFGTTTKMAALKSSARSLVTTLMKSDYAKVGLVPFAGAIRLPNDQGYVDNTAGGSNVPWLSLSAPPVIYDCFAWNNCTPYTTTCYSDGLPYSCVQQSCTCSDSRRRVNSWAGCVIDKPGARGLTIDDPASPPYVASWSAAGCSMPVITDLVTRGQSIVSGGKTYTAEAWLTSRIDALGPSNPAYNTYVPTGLIWAWHMLTAETQLDGTLDPDYPLQDGFTAQEVGAFGVRRALVLISDGNNTAYLDANGSQQMISKLPASQQASTLAKVNADMVTICTSMKTRGVVIYVIALQLGSDLSFKNLLEQCSSNYDPTTAQRVTSDFFFDTNDPTQLTQAFQKIGKSFTYLRLAN